MKNLLYFVAIYHVVFSVLFIAIAFCIGEFDVELLSFSVFTLALFIPFAMVFQILLQFILDFKVVLNQYLNLFVFTIFELVLLDVLIYVSDRESAIFYLFRKPLEYLELMKGAFALQLAIVITSFLILIFKYQIPPLTSHNK